MAFITNITNSTPDSGAFDPDGNPLGINNDGGVSLTGGSVGSDSANNVYPYVESISTPRHLTSIREGSFDSYNEWDSGAPLPSIPEGYNSSWNSNETSPLTRTYKIDTSNAGSPRYTFFTDAGPGTEGRDIPFPHPDGPCDCPDPLENRGPLWVNPLATGCPPPDTHSDQEPPFMPSNIEFSDWRCRNNCAENYQPVFSGVLADNNDPPQLCTGYFRLMTVPHESNSSNNRGGKKLDIRAGCPDCLCTEPLISAIGANCSFFYLANNATNPFNFVGDAWETDQSFFGCGSGTGILGRTPSEHGPNWTGWCSNKQPDLSTNPIMPAALYEPIPGCSLHDASDTLLGCQVTGNDPAGGRRFGTARPFSLKYVGMNLGNNLSPCLCLKRYEDGWREDVFPGPAGPERDWDDINIGTGCISTYATGICHDANGTQPAKQYILWPTGGGGPGSGDNVEPYWSDDHCDWIFSIREVVEVTGQDWETNPCTQKYRCSSDARDEDFHHDISGIGGIIRIPKGHLWEIEGSVADPDKGYRHQYDVQCISGNLTPAGTGVCLFNWNTYEDPPAWNEQSASCTGTCVEPAYDGSGEGEVGSGTCT